jgi:hypothetical protein
MKTGKLIHIMLIISMLSLYACGGGGGGGGGDSPPSGVENKKQYSLTVTHEGEGSVTVSPYSQGLVYDEGTTVSLEAVGSSSEWSFDHWEGTIESADSKIDISMNQNYSLKAVFIKLTSTLSEAQAQDALYAVYAGIGYDKSNNTSNAVLYDVMVENFNLFAESMIFNTIFDDPAAAAKLLKFYSGIIGVVNVTFESTLYPDEYTSTLLMEKPCLGCFKATLNVSLKNSGYQPDGGDMIFYGTGLANDVSAIFSGEFQADITSDDPLKLTVKTVRINAGDGLIQQYLTASIVFDKWALSYDISYDQAKPVNYSLLSPEVVNYLPSDLNLGTSYADFRNYTIGGSFTINTDNKFSFADGFRYKQEQWDYNNVSSTIMSANGKVGVPGLDGYVTVSSVLNAQDPSTYSTIINHIFENGDWSNDWVSGKLIFSGTDSETQAVFDNGSVTFTNDSDSWDVDNWRTALDPLN